MKQGKASSSREGSTKQEPISHPVNIGTVSKIGGAVGTARAASTPLYSGKGVQAPAHKSSSHPRGSQGKY